MSARYVIVIPDGAADEPHASLGGKTPLQAANLPALDGVAREGIVGRSRNVPDRFLPASDVATLSLFGYNPERYYTGRARSRRPPWTWCWGPKTGPSAVT